MSLDCKFIYTCDSNTIKIITTAFETCGINGVCTIKGDEPACICRSGFKGDGYICKEFKGDYTITSS